MGAAVKVGSASASDACALDEPSRCAPAEPSGRARALPEGASTFEAGLGAAASGSRAAQAQHSKGKLATTRPQAISLRVIATFARTVAASLHAVNWASRVGARARQSRQPVTRSRHAGA